MFRHLVLVVMATSFSTVSIEVLANVFPKPDRKGDYYNALWHHWQVVDPDPTGLNCRSGAGSNYPVIEKFYNGDGLNAASHHLDNIIIRDKQGNPWLAVEPTNDNYYNPCFVRANRRFIRPSNL